MPITLTDNAANRILQLIQKYPENIALRISVEGGGCAGFSYKYDLADTINANDIVIENGQAKLIIDEISLPFLEGSNIDFVKDLMGNYFNITNPNSTSSCGCGTSFSI